MKLTKFNFDSNVKRGAWFVKFYAPWCTHCQRLAPIWEKLADQAIAGEWPVKIADVDCTTSKEICEKAQVKGFPTLALISNGVLKGKYHGEASVTGFQDWLNNQEVLAGKAPSDGAKLDLTTTTEQKPTMSHGAALSALLSNMLGRFPTKSRIINVYFYGFLALSMLVGLLCLLVRVAGPGEEYEHEKAG